MRGTFEFDGLTDLDVGKHRHSSSLMVRRTDLTGHLSEGFCRDHKVVGAEDETVSMRSTLTPSPVVVNRISRRHLMQPGAFVIK
ncbi:MAG: hypothetical protein KDD83_28505, partial [Caldilineaceae bacterium]|nr:hypothetical protein [Caldilineaceae bacterium]